MSNFTDSTSNGVIYKVHDFDNVAVIKAQETRNITEYTENSPVKYQCIKKDLNSVSVSFKIITQATSDSSSTDKAAKCEVSDRILKDISNVPLSSSRKTLSFKNNGESFDFDTDFSVLESLCNYEKSTILVGRDFQAVIPEKLTKYDESSSYENEDILLWYPSKLPELDVEDYLREANSIKARKCSYIPAGNHVRDNEQDLYLLMQCGHNKNKALCRISLNPFPLLNVINPWSKDDCIRFENALKEYRKDFHKIHMKINTRTVKELVQFYYLWKKTERCDELTASFRTEKKTYMLNSGGIDYVYSILNKQNIKSTNKQSQFFEVEFQSEND